ncbi:MAG: head GIN domain-containing protein, partial [Planctomycetota bacterium]
TLIQGDAERLTIEADDNLLPLIRSRVEGRRLIVGPDNVTLRPSRPIRIVLRLKRLQALALVGRMDARSASIEAERLDIVISGSGSVAVQDLEADTLEVVISGSGTVLLAGNVRHQSLNVSGSGGYESSGLKSRAARLRVGGSGNAKVWVTDELDAAISGSGTIGYYGRPNSTQKVSGSGEVRSLGNK